MESLLRDFSTDRLSWLMLGGRAAVTGATFTERVTGWRWWFLMSFVAQTVNNSAANATPSMRILAGGVQVALFGASSPVAPGGNLACGGCVFGEGIGSGGGGIIVPMGVCIVVGEGSFQLYGSSSSATDTWRLDGAIIVGQRSHERARRKGY